MSTVTQCDWCGTTAIPTNSSKLNELPLGWSRIGDRKRVMGVDGSHSEEICSACASAMLGALDNVIREQKALRRAEMAMTNEEVKT